MSGREIDFRSFSRIHYTLRGGHKARLGEDVKLVIIIIIIIIIIREMN
jgi:hypothetical protein